MNDSQIILENFHSKALEGNPLNDPVVRRVPVYLPPGYDPEQRYPSVYLLAAFAARGMKLLNDDLWQENIQERLDRLILSGEIQPLIVVMPDASTRYGGSQYLNSSATGQYEDSILELVNSIDQKYPTIAEANQRAVMGHSSGGFGALQFGMRHPDIFGLVAAHAPDLNFEIVYPMDFAPFARFYEKAGAEGVLEMLDNPGQALEKGTSFYVLAVAAMASCYSPNPESPWGFDLPFDTFTCEIIPEVWQRWEALDPIQMTPDHGEALKSLNLLYLDCGLFDEENLLYGARILSRTLDQLGISYHYEEFEGGHRNTRFRYDVSLKIISEKFGNS
jgi:enterochelin esterase family protein